MNKLPEVIQFSNVATKLKFQAQFNNAKKEEGLNSMTFYYQMTLPVKIHKKKESETLDDLYNQFEDTILGKVYGGVIIEKYKIEPDMKSYLIHDGRFYKLGKSKNPEKRLKELMTANPMCRLICYSEFIPERFFHEVYAHRRKGGEWFALLDNEVEIIIKMMRTKNEVKAKSLMRMCARQLRRNNPTREEIKIVNEIKERRKVYKNYDKALLSFGKYKGTLIKDMQSDDQRKYLFWAYHNLGNMDKMIKQAIKVQLSL